MTGRNKTTGEECDICWEMCDVGRKCHASDKPGYGEMEYNAVMDDYEVEANGRWIDGLEYIEDPYKYWL